MVKKEVEPFQDGKPGEMASEKPITAASAKLDNGASSTGALIPGTSSTVNTGLTTNPFRFVRSDVIGNYENADSVLYTAGTLSTNWSSSYQTSSSAFNFYLHTKSLYPSSLYSAYSGNSLRCLHSV